MTRSSFLCVFFGANMALAGCDIPAATFDGTSSDAVTATSSGAGGNGGSTSSDGGSTVTHPTTTSAGGSGSTGGFGGLGGSGGITTTTTTTTTTTSGGGAIVPCGYPNPVTDCDPGKVCCFDKSADNPIDSCGDKGSCVPSSKYAELQCNTDFDCPGKVCCGFFVLDNNLNYKIQGSYCDTECALGDDELHACATQADCEVPYVCTEFFGSAYPDYKFCGSG